MPTYPVLAVVSVGICVYPVAVSTVWRLTTAWGPEEVHSH